MKERYVKENTIMVNLQNQKYFKKDKEGKYSVVAKTGGKRKRGLEHGLFFLVI
jgi:hypothetical protein